MTHFEYRVCQTEEGRVTFVDEKWSGAQELNADDPTNCLDSCLPVSEFLRKAGAEGWELVTAVRRVHAETVPTPLFFDHGLFGGNEDDRKDTFCHTLYLKRAIT